MKILSTIKIVLISIVGLTVLTFLTVDAPEKIEKKLLDIKDLPKTVELIGFEDQKFATKSIIKPESVIFVGNHESIVLANNLYKMLNLKDGQFTIISNISDAPWFIKRWQAHTKNEQLKGEKHLPWIYDRDGAMRNFLRVPTSDAVKYFVYKVDTNGVVNKVFNGKVKLGTIDGKMSSQEIKENLSPVVKLLN